MSVQTFACRLFGGRALAASYDNSAQTITVLGQSISISSLPASLQAQWQTAVTSAGINTGSRPAFGGDNIDQAVGAILDNQPAWRSEISAVLATVVDQAPGPN